MRAVVTRVKSASVSIDGAVHGAIGPGLLVLLGVHQDDTEAQAKKIADKICGLRIFEDAAGKMNVNPADAGAQILIISQFTLFADCRSRRPGFSKAAGPRPRSPSMSSSSPNAAQGALRSRPASSPRRCRSLPSTMGPSPYFSIQRSCKHADQNPHRRSD